MADIEVSTQLFSQAATLMFVGMGFVFAFLGLLIVVIRFFIAPLAQKYPDKVPQTSKALQDNEQSAIVAAITVAINKYRHQHK